MIREIPSSEVWGPYGPRSNLMYVCMGGAGTVFRGVWKVRLRIFLQCSFVLLIATQFIPTTNQGLDVAVKKMESITCHREQVGMGVSNNGEVPNHLSPCKSCPPVPQSNFLRETLIMASCDHPNIARVHGVMRDEVTGVPSIVMKYYNR